MHLHTHTQNTFIKQVRNRIFPSARQKISRVSLRVLALITICTLYLSPFGAVYMG